jgi:hypothetical protein
MTILSLTIDQGTTFNHQFTIQSSAGIAIDLTGYTFKSEIRKSYSSVSATATFVIGIVDAVNGIITISLSSQITTAIAAGRYIWDLEFTNPGLVGEIQAIPVTTQGSGYTTAPVTITGGGGSGATATATITSGKITSVAVTAVGSGYITDPLVTIGGDGTTATVSVKRGAQVERLLEGIVTITPQVTQI